ncbi:MAG: hypothetical protein WD646_10285 [Actinomycetota bacterium]
MTDRLGALLAENPGLERASHLAPTVLPVLQAFEALLPEAGLRPGTTTCVTGVGATSLGLSLVSRASRDAWTAAVGMPTLGLHAAAELGIDLDRLVVIEDPGKQWTDVLAALVDSFDVVLVNATIGAGGSGGAAPPIRKVNARVREQGSVLVAIGPWPESDVRFVGTTSVWHGIGHGHGHLTARALGVTTSGRRAAARPRNATLWLPDADGNITTFERDNVVPIGGHPPTPGLAT